jgi:hypothetical protein
MDSKIGFVLASGIHPAGLDLRSNCGCDRWVSGAPAGYGIWDRLWCYAAGRNLHGSRRRLSHICFRRFASSDRWSYRSICGHRGWNHHGPRSFRPVDGHHNGRGDPHAHGGDGFRNGGKIYSAPGYHWLHEWHCHPHRFDTD